MAEMDDFEPYRVVKEGFSRLRNAMTPTASPNTRVDVPASTPTPDEVERQNKRAMEVSQRKERIAGGDYSKRRYNDRRYGRRSGR